MSKTYVDKVEFGRLEGRVKAGEDKVVLVDGRVEALNGYLGWLIKGVIAAVLFAHGSIHP